MKVAGPSLAAIAAIAVSAPAFASTPAVNESAAVRAAIGQAQASATPASGGGAQPAELVDFDYHRFFERAFRLGIPTQRIAYELTVGADGKPTDCALSRDYRYAATDRQMCRQIMRVARFNPARNAEGKAVASTYNGEVTMVNVITYDR